MFESMRWVPRLLKHALTHELQSPEFVTVGETDKTSYYILRISIENAFCLYFHVVTTIVL